MRVTSMWKMNCGRGLVLSLALAFVLGMAAPCAAGFVPTLKLQSMPRPAPVEGQLMAEAIRVNSTEADMPAVRAEKQAVPAPRANAVERDAEQAPLQR